MPNDVKLRLPEVVVPGRRLGRHIAHDIRSASYRVGRTAAPVSVRHERHVPIYDQGDLGKCVAVTGGGLLGTGPFWPLLPVELQRVLAGTAPASVWTTDLYRELTRADPFPGSWEPEDTGSDGNTLGKVLTGRGLTSGWRHVMSIGEAHAAIQQGPLAVGTMWMSGMDNPTREGIVTATGTARGGHEYVCSEYDAARDLWWHDNSWGEEFGLRGRFAYDTPTRQRLMDMQGDVTALVPVTAPAPLPVPPPDPLAGFPFGELDDWAGRKTRWWARYARDAADAYQTWRSNPTP